MADQAKELFQKVLEVNPANDSAKIGLGVAIFSVAALKTQAKLCREFSKYWKVSA
jgi:hypothetical protein